MKYLLLFGSILSFQCTTTSKMSSSGTLPWISLFNGEDLTGWTAKVHHYDPGDNHAETFRVEDKMIRVAYDQYEGDFNDRFGHLYYDTPYSYFRIRMDYRFVGEMHPGAPSYAIKNSGIMFHSQDPRTMLKEQDWPISVEMQFLAGVEEGTPRPTGNMCSPGTDVVYQGKKDPRHCISSSSQTYFGDQWVSAELIVLGDSLVTHLINGDTVLLYTDPQIGGGVVEGFDPQMKKDGELLSTGHIALQSEGQPIDFRNIQLLNLEGCMDSKAKNYGSHFVKHRADLCEY